MQRVSPSPFLPRATSRMCLLFALVVVTPIVATPGDVTSAQGTDQPGWQQLASDAAGPTARWDHTLASVDRERQLVLFGGRAGDGTPFGDTWRFSLRRQEWIEITGPGPEPRFGHAVAVDQEAGQLYLFGGQADASTFFDDSWMFDLETEVWSRIDTGDSPRPQPRYGLSAVLDGAGNLLISHGFTNQGRFDDTWSLDLETGQWSDVSPAAGEVRPLPRCLHESIWDSATDRMLLFGGCSSGYGPCPQGDLWAFDPSALIWMQIASDPAPAPRSNPALIVDPARDRALLLDGLTADGYTNDLWSLSLGGASDGTWMPLTIPGEGPTARGSLDATISGDSVFVFGGINNDGVLADLWQLDVATAH